MGGRGSSITGPFRTAFAPFNFETTFCCHVDGGTEFGRERVFCFSIPVVPIGVSENTGNSLDATAGASRTDGSVALAVSPVSVG